MICFTDELLLGVSVRNQQHLLFQINIKLYDMTETYIYIPCCSMEWSA